MSEQLYKTADGKMLVQSRFAVRNNQRNFLKLTLPSTAVLWSASVAGRPIRPGRAPDGSLLLPLEKTRSGEEAPAFVVEVSYLDRTASWSDRGHARVPLVTVDLPISKSHLLLHHPPLFRLTRLLGAFVSALTRRQNPPHCVLNRLQFRLNNSRLKVKFLRISRRRNNSSRSFATVSAARDPHEISHCASPSPTSGHRSF
jgi:hypothetical protein